MALGKKSTAAQVVAANGSGNYLAGKVAVVTGGNSGIGTETVKALASAGCRVILACRQPASGEAALANEITLPGVGGYAVPAAPTLVKVARLDLEDLASVRAFAEIVKAEPSLDFLVLNAGIMALPKLERTANGWEKQIGTNHFGHHYLVALLREKMVAQATPSRIVALSSEAHRMGGIFVDDLHYEKRSYGAWSAYAQSKVANMLMARELADQLVESRVTAVSVHPGVIATNLSRHMGLSGFVTSLFKLFVTDKNIPQGASTTVYGCLEPSLDSNKGRGAYLCDCHIAQANKTGEDADGKLRKALWAETEKQLAAALAKGA